MTAKKNPGNFLADKSTVAPLAQPEAPASMAPTAPAEFGRPTVPKKVAYRVFNDHMDHVGHTEDEEEAKAMARKFNGTYKTYTV